MSIFDIKLHFNLCLVTSWHISDGFEDIGLIKVWIYVSVCGWLSGVDKENKKSKVDNRTSKVMEEGRPVGNLSLETLQMTDSKAKKMKI